MTEISRKPEPELIEITNERGQTKPYETVPSRLARFRFDNPNHTINTEILHIDDEVVRMRVEIGWVTDDHHFHVLATGHAEEYRTTDPDEVNTTSALENCETSALGRALSFYGYGSPGSIASAEEVLGARRKAARIAKHQPGALVAIQHAAKGGMKSLQKVWNEDLSEADRDSCRGYITALKREAQKVDEAEKS